MNYDFWNYRKYLMQIKYYFNISLKKKPCPDFNSNTSKKIMLISFLCFQRCLIDYLKLKLMIFPYFKILSRNLKLENMST